MMKDFERLAACEMNGQTVDVYDGRKWPVVHCGSVFISQSDSALKVTQVVLLSPRINEKKRKSLKHTVAIGTIHGHVQAFLRDSDLVLQVYLQCQVHEKCLMLIKRPKDAPRKLQKAQSLNNLSMSDSQLYRQHDRTDLNNLHILHKIKRKISLHSEKEHSFTNVHNSQPRVRKSGPQTTTRYTKKGQAPRPNTFVPIPELGIYTPDQHVLQNGTYAQHCHIREANNNKGSHSDNYLDNASSTATSTNGSFSSDLSFNDSVSSFPANTKCPSYDSRQRQYQHNDLYRSCLDLPTSQRTGEAFHSVNTQNLYNPHYKVNMNRNVDNIGGRIDKSSVQLAKYNEKDNYKMDANARSVSLGDLSTGLTFSLVGQKKAESVMTVVGDLQVEKENGSSCGTSTETLNKETLSSRDIHERFQTSIINSHTNLSQSANKSTESQKSQGRCVTQKIPPTRTTNDILHSQSRQPQFQEPYQHKQHNQYERPAHHQPETHKHQIMPAGYSEPKQQVLPPRSRKDSEDTISSYKSALSDVMSSQDLNTDNFNNNKTVLAPSANINRGNNNLSFQSNSIAASSREHFPVKPKRSLPNVPLTETSERIKRFTEMMKSRMSSGSGSSRNGSVDSSSSKLASPRMSSSTSSWTGRPRKSSLEATSDSEVFVTASEKFYQDNGLQKSWHNGFHAVNVVSNQLPLSQSMKHEVFHNQKQGQNVLENGLSSRSERDDSYLYTGTSHSNDSCSKYANRRKSFGDHVYYQDYSQRSGSYFTQNRGINDCVYESNEDDVLQHSQCRSVHSSDDTPVLPGDRSSDSGQTTGTNYSYNGSALDSGYTTNNDCENESSKSQPYHLRNQKQQLYPESQNHHHQSQQLTKYQDNKPRGAHQEHMKSSDQNFTSRSLNKHSSNLAHSRRFGSVQNVSSSQAHGNPKKFVTKNSQLFNNEKHTHIKHSGSVYGSKETLPYPTRDKMANHKVQNGTTQLRSTKTEQLPINQLRCPSPNSDNNMTVSRKNWDYVNTNSNNKSNGFSDNQVQKVGRNEERYRSSELLSSAADAPDGNYMAMNFNTEGKQQKTVKNQKNQSMTSLQHSLHSNNYLKHSAHDFTPLMSQSCHGDLDSGRGHTQHQHPDHLQMLNNQASACVQPSVSRPGHVDEQTNSDFYQKDLNSHNKQDQNEIRPRPVPISRTNRLARGHTLPGGLRINDSDSEFPHFLLPGQDISLFHLSQKYDFSPLLINLPQNKLLKDLLELKEFCVEISMAGVPGLPSSPQGKTFQIGTPGSAFTPVRNSLDQSKPLTAKLKVVCFSHAWEDIHKHTTLGRALEGDIVIEMNGWFCLGADVAYLMRIIENCQGSITFTVARVKENDETRYKGQTAAERIKSLECEISRLDDLIQTRDDKIRDLTCHFGSLTFKQQPGTLSAVNGKIPMEGMVIGGDEYVV